MKKLGLLAFVLILAGQGCVANTPDAGEAMEEKDGGVMMEEKMEDDAMVEDDSLMMEDKEEDGAMMEDDGEDSAMEEGAADEMVVVSMDAGNFFFAPAAITAKAGQRVTVIFEENSGVHDFTIDEIGLRVPIKEGESTTFTAPTEPGTYSFYCSIGNHRALGMEGVLTVE